jgi:AraC-like DNA-binding protein
MLFTSVVLVLIVSFLLLINNWSINKGIIFFVLAILIVGMRQLTFLLAMTTGYDYWLAVLLIHFDPLIALLATFCLYYFKSLIKGKLVFDRYFYLCAIPALVVLVNIFPYYSVPFASKLAYYTNEQRHIPYSEPTNFSFVLFPFHVQRTFVFVMNSIIIFIAFRYLYQAKKRGSVFLKKKVLQLINQLFIVIPIIVFPIFLLVIYATSQSYNAEGIVFRNEAFAADGYFFLILLILPLSFLFMPTFLYGDLPNKKFVIRLLSYYKRFTQTNPGFQETAFEKSDDLERIVNYIEKEKPYVNTAFSLHDISRSLNIPHIRVTTCFSKQLKVSFPTYRNKLRVEHATELFRSGAHLNTSIEGIAAMSGFKSKSIFYTAFKAVYGKNPMEWMKENL